MKAFSSVIDIAAPAERAWQHLSGVLQWPAWLTRRYLQLEAASLARRCEAS